MKEASDSIFEDLKRGKTVDASHPQIQELRVASYATIQLVQQLNRSADPEVIRTLLSKIIGTSIDASVVVFPPLYINYGKNLSIGKNVFINFDCTMLALGGIIIEDDVLIGPNVKLLTEGHPLSPKERHALVPGKIHLKKNVWVGAGASILSGVTVGENVVIAAGAVVRKDVPPNTVVAGVTARIIKKIEY